MMLCRAPRHLVCGHHARPTAHAKTPGLIAYTLVQVRIRSISRSRSVAANSSTQDIDLGTRWYFWLSWYSGFVGRFSMYRSAAALPGAPTLNAATTAAAKSAGYA